MLRCGFAPALVAALCIPSASAQPVSNQPLLVAAAADLSPAEGRIARSFAAAAGVRVVFSFGSSGMLKRQIENGAPYDVYLSANEEFVSDLAKSGQVIGESVCIYATGRLGLWSPKGLAKRISDLTRPEILRIAIPNPKHAPYGQVAEELLQNEGVLARIRPKIVYGENVRQAFEFARTGNAEAVITAWTLLKDAGGTLLPDTGYRPIRQAAGIVTGTRRRAEAGRFLRWLMSAEGQSLLRAAGLFPPPGAGRADRP